jgi:hypothetical protein
MRRGFRTCEEGCGAEPVPSRSEVLERTGTGAPFRVPRQFSRRMEWPKPQVEPWTNSPKRVRPPGPRCLVRSQVGRESSRGAAGTLRDRFERRRRRLDLDNQPALQRMRSTASRGCPVHFACPGGDGQSTRHPPASRLRFRWAPGRARFVTDRPTARRMSIGPDCVARPLDRPASGSTVRTRPTGFS